MPTVWSIFEDYLFLTKSHYNLRLHSFVLMSNHFHLLISTPDANLDKAMQYLMRETSREITRLSGRINQTYGSRFHRSLITSHHYFMNAYKYVYRNPVRSEICPQPEDYRFSTLTGLLGGAKLIIPIEEDTLLFNQKFDEQTFEWLKTKPRHDAEDYVRKALKRTVFQLPRMKNNNEENFLETELL